MADVPAIDTKKPLAKFSDSLKKSFTPRSSRASTPAGPSATTTPKAGLGSGSPRDVKAEAKAAAKAAKEAVAKKAGEASAASKAAAAKAGKAATSAKNNVKKAIESDSGKKGVTAFVVAAIVAAGAYLLNEKHQVVKTKPEPVPEKKGLFAFGGKK